MCALVPSLRTAGPNLARTNTNNNSDGDNNKNKSKERERKNKASTATSSSFNGTQTGNEFASVAPNVVALLLCDAHDTQTHTHTDKYLCKFFGELSASNRLCFTALRMEMHSAVKLFVCLILSLPTHTHTRIRSRLTESAEAKCLHMCGCKRVNAR